MKKFKIGDTVEELDGSLRGKVIKVEGELVHIVSEDDFEYTLPASGLVIIQDDLVLDQSIIRKDTEASVQNRKKRNTDTYEIDLHWDERHRAVHILEEQIALFYRSLNQALKKRYKKIVVIHGIGKGILKNRLLKELRRLELTYYEADYRTYGRGALEIDLSTANKSFYHYSSSY